MSGEIEDRAEKHESASGVGPWWVLVPFLTVPVGLAAWRVAGLGFGTTDFGAHFLLDLLVTACIVPLLSGPLRGRPPLPLLHAVTLLLLALYVGWLYLPAGIGTAGFLFVSTLVAGLLLRLLREKLSIATFLRSGWMEAFGLGRGDVPADAVHARDSLTGGSAKTWRRYVAFPVVCGLLLAFIAVRIARPLDKRAEAQALLETAEPYKIATAFLKAATNGNAPLFVRESLYWFVKPDRRGVVMDQASDLFTSFRDAVADLELQWIDLGTLPGQGRRAGPDGENQLVQVCGGRAMAYLEDPELPPAGLTWVDASRPHRGFYAWLAPLEVTLDETPAGLRVSSVSTRVEARLRRR